ncbi:unnamed protein product, partial [Meganyctiphanes norvegica]
LLVDKPTEVNEMCSSTNREEHQSECALVSKDEQLNMEQDNSQHSSQDFQEMELTFPYGSSSQGFNLSQDIAVSNDEVMSKISYLDGENSQKNLEEEYQVETNMEVDPQVHQQWDDSPKLQKSIDASLDMPQNSSSMIVEAPESNTTSPTSDVRSNYFCSTPAKQKDDDRRSFGNISDLNGMDISMMEQSEPSSINILAVDSERVKEKNSSSFPHNVGHIEITETGKTENMPQTSTDSLSRGSLMQESNSGKPNQVLEHLADMNKISQVNRDTDTAVEHSRSANTMDFSLEMSQAKTNESAPAAFSLFGSPPKIDNSSNESSNLNFSLFGDSPQISAASGNFSLFQCSQDSQPLSENTGGGISAAAGNFSLFQCSQDSQPSSENTGGGIFSLFGNNSQPQKEDISNKTSGFSLFGDSQEAGDNGNGSSGIFNFSFGGDNPGGEEQDGGGFSFNLFSTTSSSSNSPPKKGGSFSLF